MHDSLKSAAERLHHAAVTGRSCAPVRDLLAAAPNPLEAAYQVQRINVERAVAAGGRIVGRKIGLTAAAVRQQLGVNEPDFGTLFAATASGDGQEIPLDGYLQPKVEAEVALVLERDLILTCNTVADLLRATAFAVAALEIVDSRITRWDITLADTVADNASAGGFVLGSRPVPLASLDLRQMRMKLRSKDVTLSEGDGAACMGNPLNAAVWLANRMAQMGTPLRAGDLVLTGALGPMVTVSPACTYVAEIEGLGSVSAQFGAAPEPSAAR